MAIHNTVQVGPEPDSVIVVALTGPPAAGKSTVSDILQELGAVVLNTDTLQMQPPSLNWGEQFDDAVSSVAENAQGRTCGVLCVDSVARGETVAIMDEHSVVADVITICVETQDDATRRKRAVEKAFERARRDKTMITADDINDAAVDMVGADTSGDHTLESPDFYMYNDASTEVNEIRQSCETLMRIIQH